MNKASFLSLVRDTSRISDQDAEALEQLVVNFPYCQTAHLLIAKAAYDRGSMLSNQKLKKAAIYATNRQLLKKLIYTSDATVALHPLPETVAETPEKVLEPQIPAAEVEEKEKAVEFSDTTEAQKSEIIAETELQETQPEGLPVLPENSERATESVATAVTSCEEISATESEKTANELRESPGYPTTPLKVEETSEVDKNPEDAELPLVAIAEELLGEPVPEKAIIAEEIAIAEGLPESFPELLSETQLSVISEEQIATEELKNEAENQPESVTAATQPEAEFGVSKENSEVRDPDPLLVSEELPALSPLELAGEESNTVDEITEKLPEFEQVPENAETELQDVPDLHEMQLQDESQPVAFKVSALHDEMLEETLASFDRYLFTPEKDTEEPATATEDLQVVYPENEIEAIYYKDSIGYWMSSSRLGESLQVKNDLTTSLPFEFHPELLLEYTKTHELEKQLKPAPSVLSKQLDIIDQFLKQSPKIKPGANLKIRTEAQEDLSQKSTKISKNLASENFANILVQQGKIKKAIKIYEHLILKIPEKKAYFVAQIEKLQNPE